MNFSQEMDLNFKRRVCNSAYMNNLKQVLSINSLSNELKVLNSSSKRKLQLVQDCFEFLVHSILFLLLNIEIC